MSYLEVLRLAIPETVIVLAALVLLAVDLGFLKGSPGRSRWQILAGIAVGGCLLSLGCLIYSTESGTLPMGFFVVNPLVQLVKASVVLLSVFTILVSVDSRFTNHVGEYFALLLMATAGMMFMIGSENLLMVFVSLELVSLSLYVLTAFDKSERRSAEAALKYFLFGGMSAAFTLFGFSLIYGLTGEIEFREISAALESVGVTPLWMVAIVMTLIGFGFKVAAVPFHLWAPDTYQGAPTPVAAFVASGSKIASFFLLGKVVVVGLAEAGGRGDWLDFVPGWMPVLALLALLSLVFGNVAAIAQSSVKRLLAYSAIAHAGYAAIGVLASTEDGIAALVYYMVTYGVTVIGAFAIVMAVERAVGKDSLVAFVGLGRRSPVLAFCMLVFMLSLAGIPPLAGFFGKFYLFAAALKADPQQMELLWLVIVAIFMSAVSLYYYLQVLKQVYVVAPEEASEGPLEIGGVVFAAIVLMALAVVVLGCFPDQLVGRLVGAMQATGL